MDEADILRLIDEALIEAGYSPEGPSLELIREPDAEWHLLVEHYEGLTPSGRQHLIHTAEYIRDLERRSAIGGTGEPLEPRRARRESRPEKEGEEPEEKPAR